MDNTDVPQVGDLARLRDAGLYAPTFRIVAQTADGRLIGKDVAWLNSSMPVIAPEEEWRKVKHEPDKRVGDMSPMEDIDD